LWTLGDESSDESTVEDEGDVQGIEDSDDEWEEFSTVDWTQFKVGNNGQLSAWDQLGAGYDMEFARIGECSTIARSASLTVKYIISYRGKVSGIRLCHMQSIRFQSQDTNDGQ
jgi:hypothetical protein